MTASPSLSPAAQPSRLTPRVDRLIGPDGVRCLRVALLKGGSQATEFPRAYHELFDEAEPTCAFVLGPLRTRLEGLE
ncbi:hypothetical protein [Catenulispora subtropica]|uniref:Uncharacterized protein n=1 Tax=Catenulispora subtropica TaxID=450798 RepID=A0ABP5E6Z8_9ACTN